MRRAALAVLAFCAVTNLVRGGIHDFVPDGGAHSIAGLDLSTNAQTILGLFAIIGVQQIAIGLFELYVLVLRRDLVALTLSLQTLLTALGVYNLLLHRPLPIVVPGQMFNAALLAVLVATLALMAVAARGRAKESH